VTNKGIGELLKKWGEGASLMRGTWHAREGEVKMDEDEDEESKDENEKDEEIPEGDDAKPNPPMDSSSNLLSNISDEGASAARTHSREVVPVDASADALVSSMSSLSLVPPSIRFGRGGSRQAFPSGHRARVASSRGSTTTSDRTESGLDGIEAEISSRGRGTPRGRGRAGNREPPVIVTEGVE